MYVHRPAPSCFNWSLKAGSALSLGNDEVLLASFHNSRIDIAVSEALSTQTYMTSDFSAERLSWNGPELLGLSFFFFFFISAPPWIPSNMLAVVITQLHALHTNFFAKSSNNLDPRRDRVEEVIMSQSSVISSKISNSYYTLRHVLLPVCPSVLPSA